MVSKGYVYKLCIRDGSVDDVYIGSTFNLKQRRRHHKSNCTAKTSPAYNYYVYQFIRDNGGWDNWTMHVLEELDNLNKFELKKMERKYIEEHKPSLNKRVPLNFQTNDEWNKKEYDREYYNHNKQHALEKMAIYRETHQDERKEYLKNNKEKFKQYDEQYRANNREKIRQRDREKYRTNRTQRVLCPNCNITITIARKSAHNKTKRHLENVEKANKSIQQENLN